MTASPRGAYLSLVLLACVPGCKEKDPPPRYYADLGEEGRPLVPTSAPVHNFKIQKGSADWHPFRQPEIPDYDADTAPLRGAAAASGGAGSQAGETENAIRRAVVEYNDVLAIGSTEDLLEFFTEDQGDIAETLLRTLDSLNTKLGELATAVPAQSHAVETVRSSLAAARLLKIDIASVETVGENAATVTLIRSPLPEFLPGLTDGDNIALEVTFSRGEDGYWYIESPIITALGKIEPALKQALTEIDGLGSGVASADAVLAGVPTLAPMLRAAAP